MEKNYKLFCDELVKSFDKRGVELDWEDDIEDGYVDLTFYRRFSKEGEKITWTISLYLDEDNENVVDEIEVNEDNETEVYITTPYLYTDFNHQSIWFNIDNNIDELTDKILGLVDECNVGIEIEPDEYDYFPFGEDED